ncbi:MAG: PAS domain S-box protein [Pirellulaceae bacterium]|nr:PAS domain S-box protein [Pirellulaceae bacterium]
MADKSNCKLEHLPPAQVEVRPTHAMPSPSHVVGIGASAGGLESLETLFKNLPTDTGMAFVVIQHLSPDFKSMMYELLGRDTKMEIHRIEDGMQIEANHVYLLPPKKELIVSEGKLRLIDKDVIRGLALPIDRFFESLAQEYGSRSIGIILSGSGSDGSRGIKDIAHAGGLVICESEKTAKFDGMPLSAQGTGMVDLVLAPQDMGAMLVRYAKCPAESKKSFEASHLQEHSSLGLQGKEAIYDLFRREYDLDFSAYKEATVQRRISRRVAMSDTPNIDSYFQRLSRDKAELNSLYQDLLIGVTQFFRDEEAFEHLRLTVVPEIVQHLPSERTIRIWVSACATGEEAYSLAILFHEAFEALNRAPRIKIFATDVHRKSLLYAGRGVFREVSMKHVSGERRQRYFIQNGEYFQIKNEIRELIVFAPHNLLRDAPFTDLDFVSCRNLLIYFRPEAQTKALSLFHFGLNTGGILFLGSSETPGEISSEFETIHERYKLYRKWRQVRLPAEIRLPAVRSPGLDNPVVASRSFSLIQTNRESGLLRTYDLLLDKFMPPSLLLSENRELIDCFGGAEKLLRLPERRPSLDVLDLVDLSLRTTLVGILQRVAKTDSLIRFSNVKVTAEQAQQTFNLSVEPLRNPLTQAIQYLLTFEPTSSVSPAPVQTATSSADAAQVSSAVMQQLEDDLRYTKDNLQATIEELETSNEELQATNEELVASNEELQSTNEELHSVNEELYSVNAEHQRKISELAEVNHDLHHLLENTDVATVFLDAELRIRKFTSRIRKIFDLIDQDVGRPISSFSHRIQLPNLVDRITYVREHGQVFESEVHTVDGGCYLLRILPHRINLQIDGVVIVLVDLAPLEDLRGRLRWMSAIVESTDDAIIGEDLDGNITSWNAGAERLYGYSAQEAIGRHVSFLVPSNRRAEIADYLEHVQKGESVRSFETLRLRRDGKAVHVSLTISAVRDAANRVLGVSKIARDVSERIEVEAQLREQAKQREKFLAMLSHELRNPLNAIVTASQLLTDPRSNAATHPQAISIIQRQSAMTASLLDDLLDVTRISLGKIELSRTTFNLVDLIETIRETTLPEITIHQSQLEFEVLDRALWVQADFARLVQVHVNLIHNAAKYSPPGSPIRVSMRADHGMAMITVCDEGSGISADFLPKIFEPFVQSDETLNRSEGGLGVGLTLVKTLVELHGGTIEAFSEGRNCGSTFIVRIPLLEAMNDRSKADHGLSNLTDGEPQTAAVSNPETKTRRIVLVEDIEDIREMLQAILELDGHRVITASDGELGLVAIMQHCPDIALIDIGLPGIDGYEVARRVKQNPDYAGVRLVALTGYGQQADIDLALQAGFDTHLIKPVNPKVLAAILSTQPMNQS